MVDIDLQSQSDLLFCYIFLHLRNNFVIYNLYNKINNNTHSDSQHKDNKRGENNEKC